jgi:drug/metabolite transporter (DMT)-like permease
LKKYAGQIYLFFAFFLAGTSVISARLVSGKLGVFTITSASLLLALLFLLPVSWKKLINNLLLLSVKETLFLMVQAVCGIFLFRMFLLYGMLMTSSMEAGILTGATPALTALWAAVLLKEPVNRKKLAGIIGTVSGILMIQGLLQTESGFSLKHLEGNLLVLGAAGCESAFNIVSRIFAVKIQSDKKEALHPLVQTTLVSAMAFVLCLIPAFWETPVQTLSQIGLKEWLALFWYGLFVTALAFLFWYAGIKRCGAFTAAAFSGMMPFTSMVLSVLVLGESAGWQQWLGGALVISGMILIGMGNIPARVDQ